MDYYLSRNPRHTIIGGLRGLFRLYYFTADRQTLALRLHQQVSGLFSPMPQLPRQALQRIDVGRRLAEKLVYGQEQ